MQIREDNRRQPDVTPPPTPFTAPHTSFNASLSPRRSFGTAAVSLTDVKMIKAAFGVTVNDVVLALCAGALRPTSTSTTSTRTGALVAMVPISVRTEELKGSLGNKVASALTTLATDLDDPVERLMAIHNGMLQAKGQQHAIGADTLQNWVEFAAPAVFDRAVRLYSRTKLADRHRPLFNVTISNVPGPPFPLFVAGAKLVAMYPIGPIFDGGGMNMTVMSYLDTMDFGLNVCPELVPEPWVITDGLHDALEELKKAVDALDSPAEPA